MLRGESFLAGGVKMPRRFLILLWVCAGVLLASWAQAQQKTPTRPAPGGPKQAAKSPAVSNSPKRSPAPSNRTRRTVTRRRAARTPVAARAQLRPTRERYAEIQTALARAGYFQGSTNGDWGPSSVNALAYFQKDHGLEPSGKIDAPSLIKLGLGPKYDTPSEARNAATGPRP